jgi:hypothetical protein
MDADIGFLAGDLWKFLSENGESSALKIRSVLKLSQSHLYMALGWLAREGKVSIVYRDRVYWVSLVK